MDHIHEDLLLNFEFDSFQQNDDVTLQSKLQRQRKTIAMVKKRIVSTDSLLKKYYQKRDALDQVERDLFDSKNECKQLFKEKLDAQNCALQLENERAGLRKNIEKLENVIRHQEHCQSAFEAKVEQLQTLSKDFELKYEAEALENKMKTISIKEKDNEINSLSKDLDLLLQHLRLSCVIIRKKDKLPNKLQTILRKYRSNKTSDIELSEDEIGSNDDCIEQQKQNQYVRKLTESEKLVTDIKQKAERVEFDSEGSNDVVCSEDTGRGSSVAFFSDNDKYLSPDYSSNTSPSHADQLTFKIPKRQADKATSPIHFQDDNQLICNKCSASINAQNNDLPNNLLKANDNARAGSTINNSDCAKKLVNKSIFDAYPDDNPNPDEYANDDDGPLQYEESNNVQTSSRDLKQQHCLQLNDNAADEESVMNTNSNEVDDDSEIINILRTMALHHNLITPLPHSPHTIRPTSRINSDHIKNTTHSILISYLDKILLKNISFCENVSKTLEENKMIMRSGFGQLLANSGIVNNMTSNSVQSNRDIGTESTKYKKQQLENCNQDERSAEPISAMSLDQDNVNAVLPVLNDSDNYVEFDNEPLQLADISDEETVVAIVPEENINLEEVTEETYLKEKQHTKLVESLIYEDRELEGTIENSTVIDSVAPDVHGILDDEAVPNENMSKFEKSLKRKICLSKLEKLRSKIIQRKNKIKYAELPTKKMRKRIITKHPVEKNKAIHCDSIAARNGKEAYEKALAVVAEVREKQKRKEQCGKKLHIIRQKDAPINPKKINNVSRITRSQKKSETSASTTNIKDQNQNISEEKKCENNIKRTDTFDIQNNNNNSDDHITPKSGEITVENYRSPTGSAQKRRTLNVIDPGNRRILRSSGVNVTSTMEDTAETQPKRRRYSDKSCTRVTRSSTHGRDVSDRQALEYSDLDMFDSGTVTEKPRDQNQLHKTESKKNLIVLVKREQELPKKTPKTDHHYMQESILCRMIDKYGTENNIFASENRYDNNKNPCYIMLQKAVLSIVESQSNDAKNEMNKLVNELSGHTMQEFTAGFVKYLRDPERKAEMFNKMSIPSAPKMTRTEQILLYVVNKLDSFWEKGEVIESVLHYIEYNLFRLNKTPDFDAIDSLSHFYAILCRYHRYKNRLRQFVLEAMYSMNYKAVGVLRQCIEVWFHIIPLPHMNQAKSPLVVCLVYLLHFHKCQDKLKVVEDTRQILHKKYYYDMNDWNEAKIIDYIRRCILDVKDIPAEQKLLRTAVIILSKRKGPEWCQKNIIKNILLATIDDEESPSWLREFCVSLLGPLMKPFPAHMMINCEIVVNQLFDMLEDNCSPKMREAIYTSLTYFGHRCLTRVIRSLLSWQPDTISPEFEAVLKDFVRGKKISNWIKLIKQSVQ